MADAFRVLVCDPFGPAGVEALSDADDVEYSLVDDLSRVELLEAVGAADGLIVRSGTQVDAELITAAPRLRAVSRAGVGVDNIDLAAARERGIDVTNTPMASTYTTAEHAFTLMLAVARQVVQAHNSVAAGRWDRKRYVGIQLAGLTLGLVGFGRIGQEVASRAKAFGMDIVASDPYIPDDYVRSQGAEPMSLDDVLATADVISLHAALPPGAPPLLDEAAFASVKQGAIIINAARGVLIDAKAARAALDAGRLAGMGIDVYNPEPPPADHPLIGHPLVVHTPHLGASTFQAQRNVATQAVDNLLGVLRGEQVDFIVNR